MSCIASQSAITSSLTSGKYKVLAEGAQGTFLDIDHGFYPNVTSSNATVLGLPAGLGVPPSMVGNVYGVAKAYCTKVGPGPFPTEASKFYAGILRQAGQEYGTTTGRPRRCGFLDLQMLKKAEEINGITRWIITKVDIVQNTLKEFHWIEAVVNIEERTLRSLC